VGSGKFFLYGLESVWGPNFNAPGLSQLTPYPPCFLKSQPEFILKTKKFYGRKKTLAVCNFVCCLSY